MFRAKYLHRFHRIRRLCGVVLKSASVLNSVMGTVSKIQFNHKFNSLINPTRTWMFPSWMIHLTLTFNHVDDSQDL